MTRRKALSAVVGLLVFDTGLTLAAFGLDVRHALRGGAGCPVRPPDRGRRGHRGFATDADRDRDALYRPACGTCADDGAPGHPGRRRPHRRCGSQLVAGHAHRGAARADRRRRQCGRRAAAGRGCRHRWAGAGVPRRRPARRSRGAGPARRRRCRAHRGGRLAALPLGRDRRPAPCDLSMPVATTPSCCRSSPGSCSPRSATAWG